MRSLIGCLLVGLMFFSTTQRGWTSEREELEIDRITDAVVVISAEGESTTWGSGIVFARTKDDAYIVTANHVVRRGATEIPNLRVKLRSYQDKPLSAELLDKFDPQLDIAVLHISRLKKQGVDCSTLPVDVLTNAKKIARGDLVIPIGNPNGMSWIIPVKSEPIAQTGGNEITFESTLISQGHSGGALIGNQECTPDSIKPYVGCRVDHRGIVGIITKDQPPYGMAINFTAVAERLQAWGYPFQLSEAVKHYESNDYFYFSEKSKDDLPPYFLHDYLATKFSHWDTASYDGYPNLKDTIQKMLDKDPCIANSKGIVVEAGFMKAKWHFSTALDILVKEYFWWGGFDSNNAEEIEDTIKLLLQAGANPNINQSGIRSAMNYVLAEETSTANVSKAIQDADHVRKEHEKAVWLIKLFRQYSKID
jgi:hypothetical protein